MTEQNAREKQAYLKPTVLRIDLAADEVLATGCKVSGGTSARLGAPCLVQTCSQVGS